MKEIHLKIPHIWFHKKKKKECHGTILLVKEWDVELWRRNWILFSFLKLGDISSSFSPSLPVLPFSLSPPPLPLPFPFFLLPLLFPCSHPFIIFSSFSFSSSPPLPFFFFSSFSFLLLPPPLLLLLYIQIPWISWIEVILTTDLYLCLSCTLSKFSG